MIAKGRTNEPLVVLARPEKFALILPDENECIVSKT